MSHSARLADYRAVLTTPGALAPVLTAMLARLPIAMVGLSLLLYVQRRTGSFAIAGLMSAGVLIGVAIGAIVQGRVMDRLGPTRPLLLASCLFALTVTGNVLAIEAQAPTPVKIALAFLVGLTQPTVGSASRALWTRLLPPGPTRAAAYAYEAISMEVFFILGPALAGILIAAPWPGTGVVAAGVLMIGGGIGFALAPAVRGHTPASTELIADHAGSDGPPRPGTDGTAAGMTTRRSRLLGAIASPGMRTVALAAVGFGVTIGFVEVAVPAAATRAGQAPVGGLMIAMWSVSSVIFGLIYATRPWPRPMHLRLPALLAGFSIMIAPLAIPAGLLGLTALLVLAGLLVTPQATAHSAAIELVAPPGTVTEAFGWVITAVTLGLAFGQSVAGWLVEHVGIPAAFLASTVSGLIIAALVWARRHTVGEDGSVHRPRGDQPGLVGNDDGLRSVA